MAESSTTNKRIAKNTMFLYIRMFLVLIVSLYTSRIILNTLGVEDFGVFNVVSGFVSLFGFLNATLSTSMQRFYNYELALKGDDGIRSVYTTGFRIHLIIAVLLLVLLESVGVWYINSIMNIPDGRLFAANCVFQATVFSMILVIMQIPYLGVVLAYEKMSVYSFVSILDVLLKLGIVLLLPLLPFDKLVSYAILLLIVSILDFLVYYLYAKSHFAGMRLSSIRDPQISKNILSFSGWNLIGTFAFMINGQGLNLLLNSFFGPVVNAARGVSFQVSNAVSSFTGSITTSFRPQLVDSYARQDSSRVLNLFFLESKVCFTLVLFLIVPLIMEIDFVLSLWLGHTIPEQTNIFTILVLLNTLICTINPIIGQVAFAVGKIKRYQIANSLVNILVIPVSWFALKLGCEAISVFVLTIIFSVINQTVCIIELNRIYPININDYLTRVILPCVFCGLLVFLPQLIIHFMMDDSILRFLIVISLDCIFTLPMFLYVILRKQERKSILNMLFKK